MKVDVKLYYHRTVYDGIVHADKRIVYASCKSETPNSMDCERLVHASFWSNGRTFEQDLSQFKQNLVNNVYENEDIEIFLDCLLYTSDAADE